MALISEPSLLFSTRFWLSSSWLPVFVAVLLAVCVTTLVVRVIYRQRLDAEKNLYKAEQTNLTEQLNVLEDRLNANTQQLNQWQEKFYEQQSDYAQLRERLIHSEEWNTRLEENAQHEQHRYRTEHKALQEQLTDALTLQASLKAQLESAHQSLQDNKRFVTDTKQQLTSEFNNIANTIFDDKREKLTAQNQANLDQLLTPLKEQIQDFKQRVNDVYDQESKARVSLLNEVTALKDMNIRISDEALRLSNALKNDNKIQGNWGELVLERILESSGLREGIEYDTQVSINTEEGRRQPDVIVHLPDNKDVIIDSKVSLLAWERFCNEEDESLRQRAGADLLKSLKQHARGLSQKNYSSMKAVRSLDFVLMFVPVEGAFLKAIELDNRFFVEAFDQNIMVVSPSTLLVTLRTIQSLWRNEYQNRNALIIAQSAGGLHDQFVLFTESLEAIGNHLDRAQHAYDHAYKRLCTGKGNLINRTQSLEKLGAKTQRTLSEKLKSSADDENTSAELPEPTLETPHIP